MRINRDVLIKMAHETVDERVQTNHSLLAAYLHGSLLYGDPFIGGAADVDIVLIQNETSPHAREIVPLTDDIHLDIAIHDESEYQKPRNLRVHPWLGSTLFDAKILYDPRHKMDFIQAGVRGMFHRPEFAMQRSLPQVEHARQIWMGFQSKVFESEAENISTYLKGLEHAVNGIALLSGPPLTERRFLLNLPERADEVGKPELYARVLSLLGSPNVKAEEIKLWLVDWEKAFEAIPDSNRPQRLQPERKGYYLKAMKSILDSEHPMNVLWLLLKTWVLVISCLPKDQQTATIWNQAMHQLGLNGPGFKERLEEFDAYLDLVEETVEGWGGEQGI